MKYKNKSDMAEAAMQNMWDLVIHFDEKIENNDKTNVPLIMMAIRHIGEYVIRLLDEAISDAYEAEEAIWLTISILKDPEKKDFWVEEHLEDRAEEISRETHDMELKKTRFESEIGKIQKYMERELESLES